MDPMAPARERTSTGRTVAGYVATTLGALVGGIAGGFGGFGVGAWYADRLIELAERQWDAAFIGTWAGASAGSALLIWLLIRGSGLPGAGPTAAIFGAFVPAILAAPLLWGRGLELTELLGTVVVLTLLAAFLARAVAIRISRAGDAARRTGIAVAVFVWAVEFVLGSVWLPG
jgi:hypothetical protein